MSSKDDSFGDKIGRLLIGVLLGIAFFAWIFEQIAVYVRRTLGIPVGAVEIAYAAGIAVIVFGLIKLFSGDSGQKRDSKEK